MAALLALSGCGVGGGGGNARNVTLADMDEVTLRVATLFGPDNWHTEALTDYAAAVEARTEGKVTFEFLYAGSLLGASELAGGLRDGIIDLTMMVPVYTPEAFPYEEWLNDLGFMPDESPIAGELQGAGALLEWSYGDPDYLAEFEDQGITPLLPRIHVAPRLDLLCSTRADTVSAAEGLKVRAGSPTQIEQVEQLGMTPVSVTVPDSYDALQRGIIDCYQGSAPDMLDLGLIDIASHHVALGLTGITSYGLFASSEAWEALPVVAQQAMWDELPVLLETLFSNSLERNIEYVKSAVDLGVEFSTPDAALKERLEAYQSETLASMAGEAPEGLTADPAEVIDRYTGLFEEWLALVVDDLGYDGESRTWAEAVDNGADTVDLSAWIAAVEERALQPHRPGGRP